MCSKWQILGLAFNNLYLLFTTNFFLDIKKKFQKLNLLPPLPTSILKVFNTIFDER
jgi:hypothetical protein